MHPAINLALSMIILLVLATSSAQALQSDGFDFPVGPPNAAGYTFQSPNGTAFLEVVNYSTCGLVPHPGEDWNAIDGMDAGDPVFAVSHGTVEYADKPSDNWGFLILIRHEGNFRLADGGSASIVWSVYGHLGSISSNPATGERWKANEVVRRGQQLGTIGDFPHGSGRAFHLHFEIRRIQFPNPWSFPCSIADKSEDVIKSRYLGPSVFINLNRPSAVAARPTLVPYDSFPFPPIDSTKWSPSSEIHTASSLRAIENGVLRLRSTTLNVGDIAGTTLRFINPASIRGYAATVAVEAVGTGFSDNQVARLIGTFYKSFGNAGGVGFDGDIFAAMRITGNQASGLQASFTMFRCLGSTCSSAPHVFTDFLGPVALGSKNMLLLLWDGVQFSYGINNMLRIFDPSSVAPVVAPNPGLQRKVLDTQAFFTGSITATFDDVLVAR